MSATDTVVKLASELKVLETVSPPPPDVRGLVTFAKRLRGMGLALTPGSSARLREQNKVKLSLQNPS